MHRCGSMRWVWIKNPGTEQTSETWISAIVKLSKKTVVSLGFNFEFWPRTSGLEGRAAGLLKEVGVLPGLEPGKCQKSAGMGWNQTNHMALGQKNIGDSKMLWNTRGYWKIRKADRTSVVLRVWIFVDSSHILWGKKKSNSRPQLPEDRSNIPTRHLRLFGCCLWRASSPAALYK